MTDLARRHVREDVLDKILIVSGKPFERIVKAAGDLKADFIVMATHGYTGLKHMLLGSTAERVIRLAPCPVLTLRAEGGRDWPPKAAGPTTRA
jgi:nucleotide-binding universal stress UspA family protein